MPSPESKYNFALLRDRILSQNGKQYWRSLDEYADTPEFKEFVSREYPHEIEEWDNGLSRRNFVKVMGASLALAGLTGCVIQPSEKIVPYVHNPEGILPGKSNFYATAMTLGGVATGLLAKSFDGRPIKIEGNPDHPGSRGTTDILAQAAILGMYDPDRSRQVLNRGVGLNWESLSTELRGKIEEDRQTGGSGIRFLSETVISPTLIDQFNRLKAELPNAKWIQYEPVNADNAMNGARMAFGSPVQTIYKLDNADRILSLDADFLSGFNVAYVNDFAKGRRFAEDKKEISRLYSIETSLTITGAKADHRLAVKPSQMPEVAKAIAKALGVAGANSTYTDNAQWIAVLAKDLMASKGRSVVIAGDQQPPIVHALAHAMNAALGAVGQTVQYAEPFSANADRPQIDQFRELIGDIDAGRVKTLIILGGNPMYNSPADLKLDEARMDKVPLRIHLGLYDDETAAYCHWHINEKHFLEGWTDTRAYDGTVTIAQPLIDPLYNGKSVHELVQLFFKENFDKKDHDIVKEYWQRTGMSTGGAPKAAVPAPAANTKTTSAANASAAKPAAPSANANSAAPTVNADGAPPAAVPAGGRSFEDTWRKAVHDGLIANSAATPKNVTAGTGFLSQPAAPASASGPIEVIIKPDPSVYDGRFANNGWLQELPNPLNKVTWTNVGLISPATAQRLGINQTRDPEEMAGAPMGTTFINTHGSNMFSDLVSVKYQGAELKEGVPMWITPGQPDDVITLFMGYGRTRAGNVGNGLGYNVFNVRRSDAPDSGFGDLTKLGTTEEVASTQTHFNMEGRDLLRSWDMNHLAEEIEAGHQHNEYDMSMYPYEQHQATYDKNHKWAMSVDLNSCVGCNACIIACQSENNIPVVGKEQVGRHRAMHWMRVDAYYAGESVDIPEGPHFQPVLCQQCEQAPCEVVCPVHATAHSAEGLNDMTYNRCVGTRYCSNNCPYKVRRFNFMLYQDWDTPQYKLMRNPEVTVRSRGVMEKCNYCVQRIAGGRIAAEKDGRAIRDGEVVTACQSVCPTNAITFGDMHDQESAVAKTKKDERNYNLLNELNTQPRTTYLAGLRNFNTEMPDYKPPVIKKREEPEEPTGGEKH